MKYSVMLAKEVDGADNGNEACKFTPVGVAILDGARDSVGSKDSVVRVNAFKDKGRGTKAKFERGITDCNGFTPRNGIGNGYTVVWNVSQFNGPSDVWG